MNKGLELVGTVMLDALTLMAMVALPFSARAADYAAGPLTKVSGRITPGEEETPFSQCYDNYTLYTPFGNRFTPNLQTLQPWRPSFFNAEVEPHLAVNPMNPDHIVGVWMQDLNAGLVARVSFDGGTTWSQKIPIPWLSKCTGGYHEDVNDPWLTFSADGSKVFLISLPRTWFVGEWDVLVSRSFDGGLNWGFPTVLQSTSPLTETLLDKCTIRADPVDPDAIYAVWRVRSNDGYAARFAIMFTRSTNGGETWEAPRAIYDDPGRGMQGAELSVLLDGTIVVTFGEWDGWSFHARLAVVRSTDGGESWSGRMMGPDIVARDLLAADEDSTFDPDLSDEKRGTPNDDPGMYHPEYLPRVAADVRSGTLYAVWQHVFDRTGNKPLIDSIALSKSEDGGLTWTAPVRVNHTPLGLSDPGNSQAFLPSVAVADDGTVGVFYYDFRNNDDGPELWTDAFLVTCQPHLDCTDWANWREVWLTDAAQRFDMHASGNTNRGDRLGHYSALQAAGVDFLSFFSLPGVLVDDDGDGLIDEDPLGFFDEDGDGQVDDDPIDGVDNDNDGLTDEDPPGGVDDDFDGLIDEDQADPSSIFLSRILRL